MSPNPPPPDHDPALERVDALHRQQLSALIDGELSADQARFLIRRLEHDQELSACQERWQMAGDVLRGQLGAVAPADFAARVALALPPHVAVPRRAAGGRGRWWAGGGALAAALALVAVMLLPSDPSQAPASATLLVEQGRVGPALPAAVSAALDDRSASPTAPVAGPPAAAALLAAAPAVADVPRRAATSRVPPRQAQPSLPATAAPVTVAATALADVGPAASAPASPFALPASRAEARPWPRSQLARPDAFNAGLYGAGSPFAPPREPAASGPWPAPQP